MKTRTFVRYWFRPLRGVVVGMCTGALISEALNRSSPWLALVLLAEVLGTGFWFGYPLFVQQPTPESVEAFMQENCRCTHSRRKHDPWMQGCEDCGCDYFFLPIVLGPWDEKWSIITRHHQENVAFMWLLGIVTLAVVVVMYL